VQPRRSGSWRQAPITLLCGLLLSAVAQAKGVQDTATVAADAYAQGRFTEAAAAYAELTWKGASRNADVWYNAGNAYARAGWRGAAIASYRRALDLQPHHADAVANLAYLRGQIDPTLEAEAPSFVQWLLRPVRQVPLRLWKALTRMSWGGVWLVGALLFWRGGQWARRLAWVTVLACVCGALGWAGTLLGRSLEPRAIVVAAVAPLRTGPGPDYLETYALPDGAESTVLARQAGWVQLRLADGATGWTEAERVLALPASDPHPSRAPVRWESDVPS